MSQSGIKHLWKKQMVTHIVVTPSRSTGVLGMKFMIGDHCQYTRNSSSWAMMQREFRGLMDRNSGSYRHLSMADVVITPEAQRIIDAEKRNGISTDEAREIRTIDTFNDVTGVINFILIGGSLAGFFWMAIIAMQNM